jgi:hypothetical protein
VQYIRLAAWHATETSSCHANTTTDWHAETQATADLLVQVSALPSTRRYWSCSILAGRRYHDLVRQYGLAMMLVPAKMLGLTGG